MDLQPLKSLIKNSGQPWSLVFFPRPGDPRSDRLETFLQRLRREAGLSWTAETSRGMADSDFPAFHLGVGGSFRQIYQAVPEGPEGPPFVALLKMLAGEGPGLTTDTLAILKGISSPLAIDVLITPSCPFCPRMVELAHRLAAAGAAIRTRVVDTLLFPEWVERYRIKAAPTTILGQEVFLTGVRSEAEMVRWLERLSSPDYLFSLYRNDLSEKRLAEAGARLRRHPEHLMPVAHLLEAEEFGIKLGAMALFEELIENEMSLQGIILEALTPLLRNPSEQVVGDTAFLITRIKDTRKKAILEDLSNHPNPEIVEIAREGLATGENA